MFRAFIKPSVISRFNPMGPRASMCTGSVPTTGVQTMSVEALSTLIKSGEIGTYQLIDVREKDELETAKLNVANLIHLPLSTSEQWMRQIADGKLLDSDVPTLCLCHHGVRSFRMATFLAQHDFNKVFNIEGGIDAYARNVDNSIGFY